MESFIEFADVRKVYHVGDVDINAVNGVSFGIARGEFVIVAGASGAGKSTVLNLLGGMDTVTDGRISVDGREISQFSARELTTYRRNDIGFVFQFYNLVPNLTALENVELATQICRDAFDPATVLTQVGLAERLDNFPSQLSGGEQQRVAIARAYAKNPQLLLCDEPTGALDYETGKTILKLLHDTCRRTGMTVVVITHNLALAPMGDKVIRMKNGKVESIIANPQPQSVELIEW
jgi:putative ABC transport system ATP-binding protein